MERPTYPAGPPWVEALAVMLAGTASLPGARCRGRHHLFDPPGLHESHATVEQRQAQAVGLCGHCPALPACAQWVDSLSPSKRPAGVVAGRIP